MNKMILLSLLLFFFQTIPVSAADSANDSTWPPEMQASAGQLVRAGIPQHEVTTMTQTMLNSHMQTRSIIQAQQVVLGEQRAGYGYQQTTDKIYEGLSKGVSDNGIIQAMERVAQRNQSAEKLANQLATQAREREQLRDLIASSQAAGLQQQDATALADRLRTQSKTQDRQQLYEQCYLTARELVRRGVQSHAATSLINRSLDHHYSVQEMETLRKSFIEQNRKQTATTLAQQYSNRISAGCSATDLNGSKNGGSSGRNGENSGTSGNSGNDTSGSDNGGGGNSSDSNGNSSGSDGSGGSSGGNDSNGGDNGGSGSGGGNGNGGGNGGGGSGRN